MMSTTMCGELYGQTSICTMIRGQRENSPSACGPVTVIHQRKEGRGYHKEVNCRFIQWQESQAEFVLKKHASLRHPDTCAYGDLCLHIQH